MGFGMNNFRVNGSLLNKAHIQIYVDQLSFLTFFNGMAANGIFYFSRAINIQNNVLYIGPDIEYHTIKCWETSARSIIKRMWYDK